MPPKSKRQKQLGKLQLLKKSISTSIEESNEEKNYHSDDELLLQPPRIEEIEPTDDDVFVGVDVIEEDDFSSRFSFNSRASNISYDDEFTFPEFLSPDFMQDLPKDGSRR